MHCKFCAKKTGPTSMDSNYWFAGYCDQLSNRSAVDHDLDPFVLPAFCALGKAEDAKGTFCIYLFAVFKTPGAGFDAL
jgi:hypothetical protein